MEPLGSRPFALSLSFILGTMAAGLAIRYVKLGLPHFLVKYGGSALWALMIYWVLSTLRPTWRIAGIALLAGTTATSVELFKLYPSPSLDAFRLTAPGAVLLGRFFSVNDIAVYWAAIVAGAHLDRRLRQRFFLARHTGLAA
jgi:hypothetical protein